MKYLRVWQKLALLGLVFLIPFAVVTYALIDKAYDLGIDFNRKEVDGLRFFAPVRSVLRALRDQHSAQAGVLSGDAAFSDMLTSSRGRLQDGITATDNIAKSFQERFGKPAADWEALKSRLSEVAKSDAPPTAASAEAIAKLRVDTKTLYETISDESNLTLDPESDSYWLMDVISFRGVEIAEMLTDARNTAITVVSGKGTDADRAELQRLIPLVDFQMLKIGESLEKSFKYNDVSIPKLETPLANARAKVKLAVNGMSAIPANQTTATSALLLSSQITEAQNGIYSLQDDISPALQAIIETRIDKQQGDVTRQLAYAGLGLLLVLIIGWFIMRDITKPLKHVVGIADRLAEGDVSVELVDEGRRDELGDLIRSFRRMTTTLQDIAQAAGEIALGNLAVAIRPQSNKDVIGSSIAKMGTNLSDLVGHVQRSGIQVTSSVTEIAATSKEQQATANEIAATTTEIGATSNEIFATSKELVKTMKQVGEVANDTAALAERGQTGLSRMGSTMGQLTDASNSVSAKLSVLNEKAGSINTVVTTITKVADQTNLLSLNAAIEAEKAGEYGRGFAVVATEIRRLADQTAVATYDIERIVQEMQSAVSAGVMGMDKFSEEVRRGVDVVTQVSEQLGQIIAQVQTLIPSFESVTEGMESQSAGAQQISEALTQLSEGVQQTVESLRQSNFSIENLNEAVRGLQSSVSRFRLKD